MKNQMTRVGFLCAHWCLGVLRSGALNSGLVDLRLLTCSECSACVHAACVQHPTELVGWRRNDWRCRLCRQKMHQVSRVRRPLVPPMCVAVASRGAVAIITPSVLAAAVDARRVCPRHRCATCSGAIDDVESVFLACVRCEKLYHAAPECRPSSDAVILLEQRFDSDDDRIVFVRCRHAMSHHRHRSSRSAPHRRRHSSSLDSLLAIGAADAALQGAAGTRSSSRATRRPTPSVPRRASRVPKSVSVRRHRRRDASDQA
jgi:hypothetical protein